jgi:Tol biopolymer transport system component
VVYEMATGKKAFEGKSQASLIAAILEREPPAMTSLQPMTPPALDRVVKKCLAKEPDDRWHAAKDLCDELKWIAESGSQVTLTTTAGAKGIRALGRRTVPLMAVSALFTAVIVGLAVWNLKPSPRPESRFTITLPPGQQLAGLDFGHALAISPDGTHLAYIATQGGIQQLYLRAMDSLEAKPVPGTERAVSPFFSPDGKWIGFSADGKLMKVSVDGGVPLTVCDAPSVIGVSWGDDDRIVFARQFGVFGLSQVSAAGGKPQALTTLDPAKEEELHRLPEVLPGGKAVLFTQSNSDLEDTQIVAQRLGTGERRVLVRGGTDAHYLPTGHLVYAGAGALMAIPFDPSRLQVTGNPISIADGISLRAYGVAQVGISNTGSLVYVPGGGIQGTGLKLVWVDRKGAEQPLAAPPRAYQSPRLSPDGHRIAVVIHGANDDIWVYDIPRQTFTRLTFAGENLSPLWTRDGRRIIFRSSPTGSDRLNLFWKSADGSGEAERLTASDYDQAPSSLSPDGQVLVFDQLDPTTNWDLWMLPLTGDRKPRPFLQTPRNEWFPDLSPDGHWLAYASDESGQQEIYVRPFPTGGGKWQISTEGGIRPFWTRNGELVYRNGDKMMAVSIATQPTLSVGTPRLLFERHYEGLGVYYDVTPDGHRFLMLKASEQTEAAQTQINVVQNWFEELKQKVPTGKK